MVHIPLKVTTRTQPDVDICAHYFNLYTDAAKMMPSCVIVASKLNLAIWNLFKEGTAKIQHDGLDHWEACVQLSAVIRAQFGKYRRLKCCDNLQQRMKKTACSGVCLLIE